MQKYIDWAKSSSVTRYVPIGFAAFLIDIGLLNLGLKIGLALLVANGISVTVAIVFSYLMHRHFTFAVKAKKTGYQIGSHYQFIIFIIISLTALLLNEALMGMMVTKFASGHNLAKIITSAVLFVWNYVMNKLITFRTN